MKTFFLFAFLLNFTIVHAQNAGRSTADYLDKWALSVDSTLIPGDHSFYLLDDFWMVPRANPAFFNNELYTPQTFRHITAARLTNDSTVSMYRFNKGDLVIFVNTMTTQKKEEARKTYDEAIQHLSAGNNAAPALIIDSVLVEPTAAYAKLKEFKLKKGHRIVFYKHAVPLHPFGAYSKYGLIELWTKK